MVSLEFFIDIILPIALWPWCRLSLWQKWVPGGFPGDKCGRCVRLTSLPPPCAVVMKSGNLNFLEPLQDCKGTDLPFIWIWHWQLNIWKSGTQCERKTLFLCLDRNVYLMFTFHYFTASFHSFEKQFSWFKQMQFNSICSVLVYFLLRLFFVHRVFLFILKFFFKR